MNEGKTMTFNLGKAYRFMSQDRKTGILSLFSEYVLFFGGKVKILITGFRTFSIFKGLVPFYRLHFKAMFILGIFFPQF